jgi:two-component system, NarL family, sensor kinase
MQEALSNVRRRASATQAAVILRSDIDQIDLMVRDDGTGFRRHPAEPHGQPATGAGIAGMTVRLRQLGGDLEVRSGPTGTVLHGVLPMDSTAACTPVKRIGGATSKC